MYKQKHKSTNTNRQTLTRTQNARIRLVELIYKSRAESCSAIFLFE